MDSFDRRILAVLKNALFWEVGFSHNTLRLHIAKLKRKGKIVEEKNWKWFMKAHLDILAASRDSLDEKSP